MAIRKSAQAILYLVLQLLLMSAACGYQCTIEEHSHEQLENCNKDDSFAYEKGDNFSHILNDDGKPLHGKC